MIGSLVIIINKFISRRIIQRIPKSNILPRTKNDREESTQISTLHSTPQIIPVEPKDRGDLSLFCQSSSIEQKSSSVFPVRFFSSSKNLFPRSQKENKFGITHLFVTQKQNMYYDTIIDIYNLLPPSLKICTIYVYQNRNIFVLGKHSTG